MNQNAYVIFKVDEQFYALSVGSVKQIIRSVELTYLHEAPELLQGLINLKGKIVPVMNIRKQFQIADKAISLSDRIVIAVSSPYIIAFIADFIEGIIELSQSEITPSENIYPAMEDYILGTAKYDNHTVLIYDIGSLFPKSDIENIINHINNSK